MSAGEAGASRPPAAMTVACRASSQVVPSRQLGAGQADGDEAMAVAVEVQGAAVEYVLAVAPGAACPPQGDDSSAFGILSLLPPELLDLVLSRLQNYNPLRTASKSMHLAMNKRTLVVSWAGPREGAPLLAVSLPASTGLVNVQLLDCSGLPGRHLGIHSLTGCPPSVQVLVCRYSWVTQLGPLAACTVLQTLDCSNTAVVELGPLAACASLQTLNCSNTGVVELGPLAACASLQTLNCCNNRVADLRPLAACGSLQELNCSNTRVADLPLAACSSLQTLNCSYTNVMKLGPLAACTSLQTFNCRNTQVYDLFPLAACTSLRDLNYCHTQVRSVSPLQTCTQLVRLTHCSHHAGQVRLLQEVCPRLRDIQGL